MRVQLRKFQQRFLANALSDAYNIAALSTPRGNGKSFLAAHILERALTPGDPLFVAGKEVVHCAGSIEQARHVYGFVRLELEAKHPGEFRFIDSVTRLGAVHKASNSRLRVLSSNGKTGMGLVNTPFAVADEPGSWEINGGALLWDALTGALGKPNSPLKIIVIGTLAPMAVGAGHWYYDLIHDGTKGRTYVQTLQGDRDTWDSWQTIRKANPLTAISADFRRELLERRDAARGDPRLKASFLSYRLNLPTADESASLLTVDDWQQVEGRDVPERDGAPVVGVDLGGGRAFSAATAIYPSGRVEAMAVAPGIPSLEEQEKRDRVPKGTYQRLADSGQLEIAEGLRVQPPAALWDSIRATWGRPRLIVCDRFRLPELQDVVKNGARIEPRVTMWAQASADIRALRRMAKDGPLSVSPESRALVAASLSRAKVENDSSGNVRMVKWGYNNTGRDDTAASLVLAAGGLDRLPKRTGGRYLGSSND